MNKIDRLSKKVHDLEKRIADNENKDKEFVELIKAIIRPVLGDEESVMNYIKGMDIFKNEKFE